MQRGLWVAALLLRTIPQSDVESQDLAVALDLQGDGVAHLLVGQVALDGGGAAAEQHPQWTDSAAYFVLLSAADHRRDPAVCRYHGGAAAAPTAGIKSA